MSNYLPSTSCFKIKNGLLCNILLQERLITAKNSALVDINCFLMPLASSLNHYTGKKAASIQCMQSLAFDRSNLHMG